ncbi:Leucine aminopeptidase 1 [Podochytrium sp. JEL0797]|nr:Leucine aminopeptidase 1 [Podochytrium sp. JEL0797]
MLRNLGFVLLLATSIHGAVLPLQKLLIQQIDHHNALGKATLASEGFRLISTSPDQATWMTEEEILGLRRKEIGFMDVTMQDLESLESLALPKRFAPPSKLTHQGIVSPILDLISIPRLEAFLTHFTTFRTRYYQSTSGAESAEWLFSQIHEIKPSNPAVKTTVTRFLHEWTQPSIIARIEPTNSTLTSSDPIVIIGSHQDSVNLANPYFGRAPGADDDGSGTTTTLEAYRVLLASGFVPTRAVEFHFYSGEEAGLLGSQRVAARYKADGKQVAGMYQVDMTGYTPPGVAPKIAIMTDFVDPELTLFLRKVAKEYSSVGTVDSTCGYACSDHGSWSKAGYASVFGFEAEFKNHSPFIHSVEDVVENVSFEHVARFVRVCVGFAVEMSLVE